MISKISSIAPQIAKTATNVGKKINESNCARNFIKIYDANGFDNSFIGLMSLMISTVIIPRFVMAKNRNPENKEATKDEIKEVLFRDIQTCTIMLFALKMLNSLIANGTGKAIKLPMTNKPFEKVFESSGLSNKLQEFRKAPKEKLKAAGRKILDLVHPTGGVLALSDKKFISEYSGMKSFDEISKMLSKIDENGGNSDVVLKRYAISDIVQMLKKELLKAKHDVLSEGDTKQHIEKLESTIKKFETLANEENLAEKFKNNAQNLDQDTKGYFLEYFKNQGEGLVQNGLVKIGSRLNGVLRWLALGIECAYLGFGIPALNQRRLEKKYLKENGGKDKLQKSDNAENNSSNVSLVNKNINPKQVKLYHSFIK